MIMTAGACMAVVGTIPKRFLSNLYDLMFVIEYGNNK